MASTKIWSIPILFQEQGPRIVKRIDLGVTRSSTMPKPTFGVGCVVIAPMPSLTPWPVLNNVESLRLIFAALLAHRWAVSHAGGPGDHVDLQTVQKSTSEGRI